jgi:hypothetical protein
VEEARGGYCVGRGGQSLFVNIRDEVAGYTISQVVSPVVFGEGVEVLVSFGVAVYMNWDGTSPSHAVVNSAERYMTR